MNEALEKARQFIYTHGRLLERKQFEVRFENGSPDCVGRAVKAYQNTDGGLGHALEPDIRSAYSQPGFIGFGLAAMTYAGCRDPEFARSLARYLAGVSDSQGLVPFHFENAFQTAIAPHWVTPTIPFGVNPTAEICGFLHLLIS